MAAVDVALDAIAQVGGDFHAYLGALCRASPPPRSPAPRSSLLVAHTDRPIVVACAQDPDLQTHLATPAARAALRCWVGGGVAGLSGEAAAALQSDPSVRAVYPALRALDDLCAKVVV